MHRYITPVKQPTTIPQIIPNCIKKHTQHTLDEQSAQLLLLGNRCNFLTTSSKFSSTTFLCRREDGVDDEDVVRRASPGFDNMMIYFCINTISLPLDDISSILCASIVGRADHSSFYCEFVLYLGWILRYLGIDLTGLSTEQV